LSKKVGVTADNESYDENQNHWISPPVNAAGASQSSLQRQETPRL
jgi:hypothetical protein